MNLIERKTKLKKEEILRAAANIIERKGLKNVTMEDIASDLSMTKGSLYYYFKNKEELIYKCHELALNDGLKVFAKVIDNDKSPTDQLKDVIKFHVKFVINNRESYNLMYKPEDMFPIPFLETIIEKRSMYEKTFDSIIEKGIELGEFNVNEIKMSRMMILGAMNWIQQWYSPDGPYSIDQLADIYSEHLLKIFTTK